MTLILTAIASLAPLPIVSQAIPAPTVAPTIRQVFVLDDATGAPVPGATVYAIHEHSAPVWGQLWFSAAALTDADGRAVIPLAEAIDGYSWLMAQAEGYGTLGGYESGSSETKEFRLKRETPITIEVVDFLGRPLPLAHLGVAFGCGHTPDLVSAVTGPDGRATLHGVAENSSGITDLYVVHPELSQLNYDSVPYDEMKNGVARYHGAPGCVLTGRLLLPSGEPAVGFGVGNNESHRGHWAQTDEQGEFRLFGCDFDPTSLMVVTPGSRDKTFFKGARAGAYRTLQLDGTHQPDRFVDGQPETEHPTSVARLQIHVPNPEGVDVPERLRWVPVVVWEKTTGMAVGGETDETGAVGFALPAGHYAIEVGGPASPYPTTAAGGFTIDSTTGETPIAIRCDLPAPRVAPLEIVGLRPDETVYLMTATGPYLRYDLSGPTVDIPSFLVPSGRWSAHTYRNGDDGIARHLDMAVPRDIVGPIRIALPE